MRTIMALLGFVLLAGVGCGSNPSGDPRDSAPEIDGSGLVDGIRAEGSRRDQAARRDGSGGRDDTARRDTARRDTARRDAVPKHESMGKRDARSPDIALPDVLSPDVLSPDVLSPDMALPKPDGPPNTTGLTVPCAEGPGWTVFRFHYGGGSKSAQIDVWDASCNYSFAPNSACNVREVYPGFGSVKYTSQGYPIFTTTQYLRVRFSVAGLKFKKAAVYVRVSSYWMKRFRLWSPLYGERIGGPVTNGWAGVDWTGYLLPTDKPSLTAIQLYAHQDSGEVAVRAVELCVQ